MAFNSRAHNARTTEWANDTYLVLINALIGTALSLSNAHWQSIKTATFLVAAIVTQHLLICLAIGIVLRITRLLAIPVATRHFITVALFAFYLIVIIADTKIFELYRFHINSMVLNLILGGALDANLSFTTMQWLYIAGVIAGVVALQIVLVLMLSTGRATLPHLRLKKISLVTLLLFFVTQTTYAWHDAKGDTRVTAQARYVPWYMPVTMKRALRRMGVDVASNTQPQLQQQAGSHLRYPRQALSCTPTTEKPNLLVIMVDSLRFDMIDAAAMPNTFRFAQNALQFNHHYSTGNSTRFGVFGFFYGLPASYWNAMLAEQRGSVLIDELAAQNYRLLVQASAPLNSPEFDRTVFSRVRNEIHWAPGSKNIVERDRHATQKTIDAIQQHDDKNPFFAFLFLDAPHGYAVPEDYAAPFTPMSEDVNYLTLGADTDREAFFNRYKNSVHFNDALIGDVLDALRNANLLDNTVVMITSDHGQEFNDLGRNYWGHNSNFSDYQIRVPLIVHWPGKTPAIERAVTSHEDIAPTLLQHLLGCDNAAADYSTGKSLFAPENIDAKKARALLVESWSNRAIVNGERIFQFSDFGAADAFDAQYNPLAGESPDAASMAAVLNQLSAFMQ